MLKCISTFKFLSIFAEPFSFQVFHYILAERGPGFAIRRSLG